VEQQAEQSLEQTVQTSRRRYGFQPGVSGNPHGRASVRIRAQAEEAERQVEVVELTAGLGHTPSKLEAVLIDELADLIVRARRLRHAGKPTVEISALIMRYADRLASPVSAAGPSFAARLGAARLAFYAAELAESER
jgi:hypothetical protein